MACENDKCDKYGLHHDYENGIEIRKCFLCKRDLERKMKLQFTLVLNGNDSIEKKLEESIKAHPNLHLDLIRSFSNAIMMSLRLTEEDNVTIESFKAAKVEDTKWGQPGQYVSGT